MKQVAPGSLRGRIAAPSSKSELQRAIAAAALVAEGTSTIVGDATSADVESAMAAARALGAHVSAEGNRVRVSPGPRPRRPVLLDCGESALCMRMFAPIAALGTEEATLVARGSLARRPMDPVVDALQQLGATCEAAGGRPPLVVRGPLGAGRATLDASLTSQVVTGLLFALPTCRGSSELVVRRLRSAPYVRVTLSVLERFGVAVRHDPALTRLRIPGEQRFRPASIVAEGDWSAAANLLVAGALGGPITVTGLARRSMQADRAVLLAIARAGAHVTDHGAAVTVRKGTLDAFRFDASDCPDLLPPLVALATHCRGTSVLKGAERLRHKESDRAAALVSELGKLGARLVASGDRIEVMGARLGGGAIDPRGDHRIAMAAAIAALGAREPVRILTPECVSKSYPAFFDDLRALGASIE